jgi:hypothetical protein
MLDITCPKFSNPNSTSRICLPLMFHTCKLISLWLHMLYHSEAPTVLWPNIMIYLIFPKDMASFEY